MKLYCVRHGEAASAERDAERPLTEQGVNDVTRVAAYLANCDVKIAHVMHSTKLRAKQTATILSEALTPPQLTECASILDEQNAIEPMVEMIKTWTDDTMLVGHLPFMPRLVSALVIGDAENYPIVNYPPGTVVCLELYDQHRWIINWILGPQWVPAQ